MQRMNQKLTTLSQVQCVLLLALGYSAQGLAQEPLTYDDAMNSLEAHIYTVVRHEQSKPAHTDAVVSVVETKLEPRRRLGLAFIQTNEEMNKGQGMLCRRTTPRLLTFTSGYASAIQCEQKIDQSTKELLTVGTLDSEFCTAMRDANRTTDEGMNTIVNDTECNDEYEGKCICYAIQVLPIADSGLFSPPDNGTGSGGGKGGGS